LLAALHETKILTRMRKTVKKMCSPALGTLFPRAFLPEVIRAKTSGNASTALNFMSLNKPQPNAFLPLIPSKSRQAQTPAFGQNVSIF
jgi:hypothetical protein